VIGYFTLSAEHRHYNMNLEIVITFYHLNLKEGVLKMKKLQCNQGFKLICFIFFFLLLSISSNAQFDGKLALFIVADDAALNTAEDSIITRLTNMGFTVDPIGQAAISDGAADGYSLVLISATVSSGTVAGNMPELTTLEIPIINWEPFIYDMLGFQELDGSEFPVYPDSSDNQIEIVNNTHPLAAGLPLGIVQISDTLINVSYGSPQGDVIKIAVDNTDTTRVLLFGYEKGAEMFSGNAPERRVGTYLLNDVARSMNKNGWMLFDASVMWAMGVEPSAVENSSDVPKQFALLNNYPNPFNPATTIAYSIPLQTNVRLSIFNTLGEKIKTLVDEVKPAGNYTINFYASGIPSGVYFYRLEAGPNVAVKKLILLK
jgi:hypothetical protein